MKALKMKQLGKKDEEIADALVSLGMSRNVAMILAYFQSTNTATALEIEKSAGLRQPEVSIAMRQLKERGWIDEHEEKKTGKGRPYKVYSLKVGFNDIIAQLEEQQEETIYASQKKIEQLKGSALA